MVFDKKNIYEIDINLGTIVKNSSLNNYFLSSLSIINFPNKLIAAFSDNDDLLLIDYYNSKMEINFTEICENEGRKQRHSFQIKTGDFSCWGRVDKFSRNLSTAARTTFHVFLQLI